MLKLLTILLLLSFAFTLVAFAIDKPTSEKIKNRQTIDALPRTPTIDEMGMPAKSYPIDNQDLQLNYDGKASLSPGRLVGLTTRDMQNRGRMNRTIDWRGPDKYIYFTWTHKSDFNYLGMLRTRYQIYDPSYGDFLCNPGGVELHSLADHSAYPALSIMPDGKAIIANHFDVSDDFDYKPRLWYKSSTQICDFPYDCDIPDSLLNYNLYDDTMFLFPSMECQIYGTDTVTHLFAQQSAADGRNILRYFRKVGGALTCAWDCPPMTIDTVFDPNYSQTVVASNLTDDVALVWTAELPSIPGGNESVNRDRARCNDIYYMRSDNMGSTWNDKVNVTQSDSSKVGWRAYQDLSAIFSLLNDPSPLHIVWNAREFSPYPAPNGSFPHYYGSRLFHWCSDYPSVINTIKDANWDIPDYGCYGDPYNDMSMVKPQISICDNKLYVVFVQFNDIENGIWDDCHNANWTHYRHSGTANGELYVSVSDNDGASWDIAQNLTNSFTSRCDSETGPNGECDADHWPSMSRYGMDTNLIFPGVPIVDPSGGYTGNYYLDIFYVNDKYPGSCILNAGVWTTNPLKWFRLPCYEPGNSSELCIFPSDFTPEGGGPIYIEPGAELDTIVTLENYGNAPMTFNSVNAVKLTGAEYDWLGIYNVPATILAGDIDDMHIQLNKAGIVKTPMALDGIIVFEKDTKGLWDTLKIHIMVADTVYMPEWASIRTSSIRLTLNNAGNIGKVGEEPGHNMNFLNDCDTTLNTAPGVDDNSEFYLFDASPFILRASGGDTILNSYFYDANWLKNDGFRPLEKLIVDSSFADYQFLSTGKYSTPDMVISMECNYWAPMSAESSEFIIQEIRVFNDGDSTLHGIFVGNMMDWDIPSDTSVDNGSGIDGPRQLMYCYGAEYGPDPIPNNDCILANQRYGGYAFHYGYKLPFSNPTTDSIGSIKYAFTDYVNSWLRPTSNFVPQELYDRINPNLGFEVWTIDSLADIFMVYAFGKFDIPAEGGLVFVNILASEYDGGLSGLRQTIDKARQWIANRPGLIGRSQFFDLRPLTIVAYSPVNLKITDPVGDYIARDPYDVLTQTIFPADYFENPPNYIDSVIIYFPIEGDYIIEVVAEDDPPPGATYTIGIRIDGTEQAIMTLEADVPAAGMVDSIIYVVEEEWHFINGDANDNGLVNIQDITFLINYLYKQGTAPYPVIAGDANCDGTVNIKDITYLINYLYKQGPAPCQQ
jgi:hypothetical protein